MVVFEQGVAATSFPFKSGSRGVMIGDRHHARRAQTNPSLPLDPNLRPRGTALVSLDRPGSGAKDGAAGLEAALEEGRRRADPAEVADADRRLDELLDKVDAPSSHPASDGDVEIAESRAPVDGAPLPEASLRTGVAVGLTGRQVSVRVRGGAAPIVAGLDEGVARELVQAAIRDGERVVLEQVAGERPAVVGVLRTRLPRELNLRADKILIEGDQEVVLRSGRGALRLRRDGDVELVGSRISAMSRGLFRLVGRVLRLN